MNGLDSNNYADILPDWSVSDFVSHVETLFNVVFLVNPNDKTVDIVRTNTFYEQSTPIYIKTDDILNEYEKIMSKRMRYIQTTQMSSTNSLPE